MAKIPFVTEFDDLAESMATPNPNRPISNAVAQFGRRVCDAISANPGTFAPTILQSPLTAACGPYWDSQGFDGPTISPSAVSGGQCAGVNYDVVVLQNRADNGQPAPPFFLGNFPGPIRSTAPLNPPINCSSPGNDANNYYRFINGQGVAIYQANSCSAFAQNPTLECTPTSAEPPGGCGDEPDRIEPGNNPAPNPGPLPPGTGPSLDIRGNPILVLPPTLEVSPGLTVELSPGEVNLGSGGGGSPSQPPIPGTATPGEGSGSGGGDNDFGDPPDGERWVGCCVHITQRPVGHGSIPQSEPETIFPDIVGNVRLKFISTLQGTEYDTPLINKQKTTCVWEPVRGLEPTGVRVNLRPGFLYSYTAYSVPLEN